MEQNGEKNLGADISFLSGICVMNRLIITTSNIMDMRKYII